MLTSGRGMVFLREREQVGDFLFVVFERSCYIEDLELCYLRCC